MRRLANATAHEHCDTAIITTMHLCTNPRMQAARCAHATAAPAVAEWRVPPHRCSRRAMAQQQLYAGPAPALTPSAAVGRRLAAGRCTGSRAPGRRCAPACAAAAAADQAVFVTIPDSKEAAVSTAVGAFLGQVKGRAMAPGGSGKTRSKRKGFSSSSSTSSGSTSSSSSSTTTTTTTTRFYIELPLPKASPADSAAFAADVVAQLPPATASSALVVFASEAAAAAAAGSAGLQRCCVMSLTSACRSPDSLGGPLLLVEPSAADVALVEQLVDEVWGGPWALALNPGWWGSADGGGAPPPQYAPLVDSWEAAYSLTITATQGLMRTEGAVLRELPPPSSRRSGGGADEDEGVGVGGGQWRVLLKDRRSGRFMQVGALKRRPTPSDLELAFINAKAAQSPLTSLVKGVRGLLDSAAAAKKGGGGGGHKQ